MDMVQGSHLQVGGEALCLIQREREREREREMGFEAKQ
jgi:hypothetical protein